MEQCPVCYERDAKHKVCKNKHKLCFKCYEKINEINKICPYCRSKLYKLSTKCNPNFIKPVFKRKILFAKKLNIFLEKRHFLCKTNKYNDFKKYRNLFKRHFKDNYIVCSYYSAYLLYNPIIIPKNPQEIIKMEKIIDNQHIIDNDEKIEICFL